MKKRQLLQLIQDYFKCNKTKADEILGYFISIIVNSVVDWQIVNLPWLGKFSLAKRKGKKGVNPRTMETIFIPEYTTPKFTASKPFKDAIKKKFNS